VDVAGVLVFPALSSSALVGSTNLRSPPGLTSVRVSAGVVCSCSRVFSPYPTELAQSAAAKTSAGGVMTRVGFGVGVSVDVGVGAGVVQTPCPQNLRSPPPPRPAPVDPTTRRAARCLARGLMRVK